MHHTWCVWEWHCHRCWETHYTAPIHLTQACTPYQGMATPMPHCITSKPCWRAAAVSNVTLVLFWCKPLAFECSLCWWEILGGKQSQHKKYKSKRGAQLKKMDLHHYIRWSPLFLYIGLGIAQNNRQSLFEPFLPIITVQQLKLPSHTHTLSVIKKRSKSSFHLEVTLLLRLPTSMWGWIVSMREKKKSKKGIMLGRTIPLLPGDFLDTGSSGFGTQDHSCASCQKTKSSDCGWGSSSGMGCSRETSYTHGGVKKWSRTLGSKGEKSGGRERPNGARGRETPTKPCQPQLQPRQQH